MHSLLVAVLASSAFASSLFSPRQAASKYSVQTPPLDTDWTYTVGTNPWPEYPRPQLERKDWKNLNGIWTYLNASGLDAVNNPPINQTLPREVLIPSCLESGLSGIQGEEVYYSWFATTFEVPSGWAGDRVLLNFGAVDYEATVFINGRNATFHRGGYFAFTADVTDHVQPGANELLVFVHDPTDGESNSSEYVIPIGKQTRRPSHIFYRPCSGIWQSVWIERAPTNHITDLDIQAGADGKINATITTSQGEPCPVKMEIIDRTSNDTVATHDGTTESAFQFTVQSPALWSPGSPNLYDIKITVEKDEVYSYTGFRTISRGIIDGVQRPLLNGEFIFAFGTLDQGYWPDGLYTPPNREAMVYDLKVLKQLNYNMVRKHIKVETSLFYQACDEMGLLVIQDMPSLRPIQSITNASCVTTTVLPNEAQQAEFTRQLELMVKQRRHFPSVYTWVIYNEGWGQLRAGLPEFALTDMVRSLDPTRLIISTSGWFDNGAGDFHDNHHYANPQCGTPFYSIQSTPYDRSRIAFQGEFAGIGQNVSIEHLWNVEAAINAINQTYEIDETIEAWRYRGHRLLDELLDQTKIYDCSGAVWTQTTDVEGEVNGMMTYDRRIIRPDIETWSRDAQNLYDAAAARGKNASAQVVETYVYTQAPKPYTYVSLPVYTNPPAAPTIAPPS